MPVNRKINYTLSKDCNTNFYIEKTNLAYNRLNPYTARVCELKLLNYEHHILVHILHLIIIIANANFCSILAKIIIMYRFKYLLTYENTCK